MLSAQDYFEIQALVHTYPGLVDAGKFAELGELFRHADVYIQNIAEPIRCDPARLTQLFSEFVRLHDGTPRTRHAMANLVIRPDGDDQAIATCMVAIFQQTPEFPLQPILTGDYRDRFARIDGEWAFIERYIGNDLFGNLSAHGRYEYQPAVDAAVA